MSVKPNTAQHTVTPVRDAPHATNNLVSADSSGAGATQDALPGRAEQRKHPLVCLKLPFPPFPST